MSIQTVDVKSIDIKLSDKKLSDIANITVSNKDKQFDILDGSLPLYSTYRLYGGYEGTTIPIYSGMIYSGKADYGKLPYNINLDLLNRISLLQSSEGYFWLESGTVHDIFVLFAKNYLKLNSSEYNIDTNLTRTYSPFRIVRSDLLREFKALAEANSAEMWIDEDGKFYVQPLWNKTVVDYTIPKTHILNYSYDILPSDKIPNAVEVRGKSRKGELVLQDATLLQVDLSRNKVGSVDRENCVKKPGEGLFIHPAEMLVVEAPFDLMDSDVKYFAIPTEVKVYNITDYTPNTYTSLVDGSSTTQVIIPSLSLSNHWEHLIIQSDGKSCVIFLRKTIPDVFGPDFGYFLVVKGDIYVEDDTIEPNVIYSYYDWDAIRNSGYTHKVKVENKYILDKTQAEEVGQWALQNEKLKSRRITVTIPFNPLFERGDLLQLEGESFQFYVYSIQHRITQKSGYTTLVGLLKQ